MLRELEPVATSATAYAFAVLFGLLWGSFANVCIYRWPPTTEHPRGRSVVAPGSHCFACKAPIRWYDNVPLLSWLWLRGRCRDCHTGFSARYLLVEALVGALFGVSWFVAIEGYALVEPFDVRLMRFAIFSAFAFVLVVIAFIDLDHKLILDKVTLPSIVVFYGLGIVLGRSWTAGLVGAAVGYGVPWAIGWIYYLLTGNEGLGLGDSKLLALVGAFLGPVAVISTLFGGALLGSVLGVMALLRPSSSDRPRGAAILAVVAVAATVSATVLALRGAFTWAFAPCVIAVLALVASRRIDHVDDDALDDGDEVASAEPAPLVPGHVLAGRVLAIVAATAVLGAVLTVVIDRLAVAGACALVAVLAIAVASKVMPARWDDDESSEPEPPAQAADEAALMRTELPFGPPLVIAALFFLFAEPWILLQFRMLL